MQHGFRVPLVTSAGRLLSWLLERPLGSSATGKGDNPSAGEAPRAGGKLLMFRQTHMSYNY